VISAQSLAYRPCKREKIIIVPRPVGDQAVACGDAALSQQDKNTRQMKRQAK
jgi:hypothetical protein